MAIWDWEMIWTQSKTLIRPRYFKRISGMQSAHYIYPHYHVVRRARISLTLSLHVSLSFIASGRSSGLHPVSSHSCCMYVRAGRPAFVWPYAGVHRSTSLTSSSLLLQQCPACLVRLACIVFVMGGRWPYSWCLVGCCCQDLGKEKWVFYDNFQRKELWIDKDESLLFTPKANLQRRNFLLSVW